jgi:hypothetical protein
MGEKRCAFKSLLEKPEGKIPVRRLCSCEDTIKMNCKGMGCKSVD